uniref:Uncharacterized protein n=1 Tax=Leersia perrieri TaxID=77586 RepID=A0A0D9V0R1_9ORYZ
MATPGGGSCPSSAPAGNPSVCLAGGMLRPRLVLFGDSITEQSFRPGGWGAALADTYSRKADVIVRGYGGYNTRWALFLLQQIFPLVGMPPPLATTVFFGANDAALLGRTSERQHDCSKSMVIMLITPPPVDEDGRERYARSLYGEEARKLPERTNEMAGVYAGQCIELAREMNIYCIDIWSKMQETAGWHKLYLSDGLHLTPEGNAVVHKEVVQTLRNAGLRAEDLSYDFPHHSRIDGNCPEKAFQ